MKNSKYKPSKRMMLPPDISLASSEDASAIIAMQQKHHASQVSNEERAASGFLTMITPEPLMQEFISGGQVLVKREHGRICGYVFWITIAQAGDSALVGGLLNIVQRENFLYREKPLKNYSFAVIGQICVDHNERGKGTFEELYQAAASVALGAGHALFLTFVHLDNERSLHAHRHKANALPLGHYHVSGNDWELVLLDNELLAAKPGRKAE